MDSSEFIDRVRADNETALDRLGSEKALVATTRAALDRETVLETAAEAEARAAATFETWADDEANDEARAAFAEAADRERDHAERVSALGEVDAGDPSPDDLHDYLRGLDDTAARVGAGLVARPLVASRSLLQVINFFVNEGDNAAETFRDLRTETDEQVEAGAALLDAVCESDDDWERAAVAAGEAIDAAYGEYADSLDSLGIDPKPVC
ncbi:rubrerythrin family protein [Natronomonas gomsonensis]|uniref:rubrerythrin family protein n=1 Tax=Natronomonas gomsonensis TaxID=1046043 RepID=UPI0015BE682A|nr:rubrerythrin family protein [Natronomonas gomsonensis]